MVKEVLPKVLTDVKITLQQCKKSLHYNKILLKSAQVSSANCTSSEYDRYIIICDIIRYESSISSVFFRGRTSLLQVGFSLVGPPPKGS